MNSMKDYVAHWVIGIILTTIWFWGDKMGCPPQAVSFAAYNVPLIIGHALAYTPNDRVADLAGVKPEA